MGEPDIAVEVCQHISWKLRVVLLLLDVGVNPNQHAGRVSVLCCHLAVGWCMAGVCSKGIQDFHIYSALTR